MSKYQFTYGQLASVRDDIVFYRKNSPAFCLFNDEKINRFFSDHQHSLRVFDERRQKIISELVKHDHDGVPMTEVGENGQVLYVFDTPEKETEYLERYNKLAQQKALSILN